LGERGGLSCHAKAPCIGLFQWAGPSLEPVNDDQWVQFLGSGLDIQVSPIVACIYCFSFGAAAVIMYKLPYCFFLIFQQVVESVNELAQIMKDLSVLVIDQVHSHS